MSSLGVRASTNYCLRRSTSIFGASSSRTATVASASSAWCRLSVFQNNNRGGRSDVVKSDNCRRIVVAESNDNNSDDVRGQTVRASRAAASRRRVITRTKASAAGTNSSSSGGDAASTAAPAAAEAPVAPASTPPAKGKKRPFIPALDSTRFFLISYITVGHFIACCTRDPFFLRLLSQVNVVVGAFFVLSGYVVAYTCTELGQYKASARISPAPQFIMSRIMGYYPLYLLAQVLFAPVFLYADNLYNGPIATAWHAVVTFTLSQAWFPAHAELWNAPTWFLSALTFATVCLPFCLPAVASWRKKGLKTAMWALTAVSLVAKIAYSYDTNGWFFMEGTMSPKTHPSWMFWNATRFSPFMALVEILIGCVAARMVMIRECDDAREELIDEGEAARLVMTGSRSGTVKNRSSGGDGGGGGVVFGGGGDFNFATSPVVPLVGMIGVLFARAMGWLTMNDALTRGLLFIPLFTSFVMRVHVQTVYEDLPNAARGREEEGEEHREGYNSFSKMLSAKWLTYLGAISFPIYILHGPIGQIFYKRAVASKLWGVVFTKYPTFFLVYLAIVLVGAVAVHELFMKNKNIQGYFQQKGRDLAEKF